MKVKRIVANIESSSLDQASSFYRDILGLELLMDLGWIQTYGSNSTMPLQISIATEDGSGTPVPDLSIEVDDLDAVLVALKEASYAIEYGPKTEPWGVRRFYVRDPFGKLLNILQHKE
jgi:catechol 2,3-dioxygenase-like lactoylglutathione lyase family enzyme